MLDERGFELGGFCNPLTFAANNSAVVPPPLALLSSSGLIYYNYWLSICVRVIICLFISVFNVCYNCVFIHKLSV